MSTVFKVKDVEVKVGDQVKISYKFSEGEKKKDQVFEGMVIKVKGEMENKMFTVRKVGKDKIGIERVFSIMSPYIHKIEIIKHSAIRRSKLYFVRGLSDKELRVRLS